MADKLKNLGLDAIVIAMRDAGVSAPDIKETLKKSYGIEVNLEDVEELTGKTASMEDLDKLNAMIEFFFEQFNDAENLIATRANAAKMVKDLMELKFKYGGKPKSGVTAEAVSMDYERVQKLLKEAGFKFNG